MIGRGFWLLAGAVLGVSGYRRLVRAARSVLLPGGGPGPARRALTGADLDGSERTGTDLAVTRQSGRGAAGAQPVRRPVTAPGDAALVRAQRHALRAAIHLGRGTGAFIRDVRIGMAEYMDRHSGRSGNTLLTQRARASVTGPGSDNSEDGR